MKWLSVLLILTMMSPGDLVMSSGSTSFIVKNESGDHEPTLSFVKRGNSDTKKAFTFQSLGDGDSDDDSEDESDNECDERNKDYYEEDKKGKGQLYISTDN